jgi:hypothetical protein
MICGGWPLAAPATAHDISGTASGGRGARRFPIQLVICFGCKHSTVTILILLSALPREQLPGARPELMALLFTAASVTFGWRLEIP